MSTTGDAEPVRPGWLGPALWTSVLRHSIPVAGVLFLGWLPLDVLCFLLLETWLFLTLHAAAEATLSAAMGKVPETLPGQLVQMGVMVVVCGAALAFVLGLVAVAVRQFAFSDAEWARFVEAAVWNTPAFRVALALMLVDQFWDAGRFAVRIARLHAPEWADDLHLQRMVLRVVVLAAAGAAAGLMPVGPQGGRAIVVALAIAMVMLEAWPEEPGPPRPEVRATDAGGEAGAPRRSRRRRARSRRG